MVKITFRVWILIIALMIALLAIKPSFEKGVVVKSIEENSTAFFSGLSRGEIIKEVNGITIKDIDDYSKAMEEISISEVNFSVSTDKGIFSYFGKELGFDIDENKSIRWIETQASLAGLKEGMIVYSVNGYDINSSTDFDTAKNKIEPKIKLIVKTNKNKQGYIILVNKPLEITVSAIPTTRIKRGLDLEGGARGLVKPEKKLTQKEMNDLISVSRYRLNVYGIADVNVRSASDLSGNTYMLVEVAGATPTELKELIGKQGKFEAKIGNETVFIGGKKDITSVCRNDATCAGIRGCSPIQDGYYCKFEFAVYLSEEAAEKHFNVIKDLPVNITEQGRYLTKKLDLFLDDKMVSSLLISEGLQKAATTRIAISGPGYGNTQKEAFDSAQEAMQKLQTILITGSLPFKLEIVKLDSVSPLLGEQFTKNVFLAAFVTIAAVTLVVFIRYKKIKLALPIVLTMLSEIFLILGVAALIKWNLDLVSIAGIIAAIGTGVDHQIVILDEAKASKQYNWKERIKRAFFIIIGAYATTLFALVPLGWAGAGLLKGFALTTIIGITIGVFITRPAFADIISKVEE